MVEIDQVLKDEELKSKVAAIGAGALVIIAGFLVYNYFSKVGKEEGVLREEAAVKEIFEEAEPSEESVVGEITQKREEEAEPEVPEAEPEETLPAWTANNYREGDIIGDEYTVKHGDTLWEIAEARYGSGFEWGKILEANKGSVGFLPNGSQALIQVGQVLVLP